MKPLKAPRISVCMIVRDEARVLPRCLRSLAGAYHELCIVDTGSTDRTPAIAERAGARTARFVACNGPDGKIEDFAAARNAALALATGDWILQVDADEVLAAGGAARIRRHARRGEADWVMVAMRWGDARWLSTRLFRRARGLRYVSRVHEYLDRPADAQVLTDRAIVIANRPDKRGKEPGDARNTRLLHLELADHPDNARARFQLGNELRARGQLAGAIDAYRAAIALDTYPHGAFLARYYLAVCHLLQQDWPAAIAAALDSLRVDPRHAEAHCLLGDVYFARGELDFARQWYRSALACGAPPETPMVTQAWAYGAYPRRRLRSLGR
ncbi:MAG TPA: glycosyltransferase [Kofleriaceae bacterium]